MERLKQEQTKAIEETKARIQQLEKFKDDYIQLVKRLKTLPDKVSHNIMVPFGSLAFMPGKLVHTNEVMVLLGDDWFAERSAKQAAEIASRRVKGVEKQISDLEKQRGLLEPRLDYTQQLEQAQEDIVEIKEEYDPEKEAQWKEEHRRQVRAYKHQLKKESSRNQDTEAEPAVEAVKMTDDEIWKRLQQLEIQERLGHEYTRFSDEEPSQHKAVSWQDLEAPRPQDAVGDDNTDDGDDDDDDGDDDDYSDSDDSDTEIPVPRHSSTIKFSHTKQTDFHTKSTIDPVPGASGEPPVDIVSPSDIYKQFVEQPSQPRSILKPARVYPDVDEMTSQVTEVKERVILPGSREAFSGEVKERSLGVTETSAPSQPGKRVSRFKQQRQAKN